MWKEGTKHWENDKEFCLRWISCREEITTNNTKAAYQVHRTKRSLSHTRSHTFWYLICLLGRYELSDLKHVRISSGPALAARTLTFSYSIPPSLFRSTFHAEPSPPQTCQVTDVWLPDAVGACCRSKLRVPNVTCFLVFVRKFRSLMPRAWRGLRLTPDSVFWVSKLERHLTPEVGEMSDSRS